MKQPKKQWFQDNREINLYARIPEDLVYCKDKEMPVHTLKVYGVLDRHLNQKTGECFPGHRRMQEKIGVSRSQIQKSLDYLEKKGFIRITQVDGQSNRYELMPVGNLQVGGVAPQEGHLSGVAPGEVRGGPPQRQGVALPEVHNESLLTRDSNKRTPSLSVVEKPSEKSFQARFVDWFGEAYREQFGKPYAASKADFVMVAQTLKAFSASEGDFETLKKLVRKSWTMTEKDKSGFCVAECAMTAKGFCSVVNRITLQPAKPKTAYELEKERKAK